jgi:hypothetical protein
MNIDAAVELVERQGSFFEVTRLHHILNNEPLTSEMMQGSLDGQREDGGWSPFWATDYSSLDATCFHLAEAEQMGISHAEPIIQRAIHFIERRQRTNGSWEEEEQVASLAPPWAQPGDVSSTLYLTSNCGYWLAYLDGDIGQVVKASEFIRHHLTSDGRLPSFLQAHWLAGGLWHRLGWEDASESVLSYLGKRLTDMPTGNLAWLITSLRVAGIPTEHVLVSKAADLIEGMQNLDGRWVSDEGTEWEVQTTLDALRALRLCGRI